jgi:methyl-accepting chemotaxis protein
MSRTAQGWLVVMQQDYEEAYESLRETNLYALILLVVTVVLVIIVALIFSRRLSQPIMRLTQAADAISRGRMDTEIEGTERADEIGLLAAAIARLRNSTRLALERLTRRSRKPD